jgi:hypothetical protein
MNFDDLDDIDDWKFSQYVFVEHLDLQMSCKQESSDAGVFS